MRRPSIRRLQRRSYAWGGAARREKARQNMMRQERFARRHGLGLLSFVILLLEASVVVTFAYLFALRLYDSGLFKPPVAP